MQYRVLGPLEVVDASGRRLSLGGARQQSVLAALLLRAGRTVALDRLVDELWEKPPATAGRTVQAYVSRLRRELPRGAIESRPGGYSFVFDGAEFDLDSFERGAEEGHAALAAGEYEQAASVLREALALWRGPPLAGLSSGVLRREAERLEELRLSVLEDRVEADLGRGRHGELVPELKALVAEHPLRERLRAQLMLALYRSGRPGDALALYREGRRLLVEELGMEPGQELRELEQAMLRQDAALEAPPVGESRSDADEVGPFDSRGTVTFLFTDIEGSTQLLKTLGRSRYGEMLSEHGTLLRAAFSEFNGEVIDSQGDAYFVAFRSAGDAVSAAAAAQRALQRHGWAEGASLSVRMGLHTGEAALRDDRYLGMAVHLAARIGSAAHGGQVLLSEVTRVLVEDELPADVDLRDLGEQRLKDIDRPVRLYQLGVAGLPVDFPPLRTVETAFAGREEELVTEAGTALRRGPRLKLTIVAAACVIAAAVAIPLFALGGGENRADLGGLSNGVGVLDSGSGAVRDAVDLPAAPTGVAAGLGYVWAVSADSNTVYAIDPKTNTKLQTIEVGNAPGGIAVGGGYVWVTNSLDGTVSQIDPHAQIELQRIRVGNGPTGVAVRGGRVWVTNTLDHTISKIRASTGKLLKTYPAGTDPGAVAVGEGAVWVASKSSDTVVKLSPRDGQVLRTFDNVGQSPAAVAVGLGSVWVANSGDGTVTQIDPALERVIGLDKVGAGPSGIGIVRGEVWTTNELAGTVSRIDPAAERPTTVPVGGRPSAVAAEGGTVYVALRPTGLAHRGGTLTVASGSFEPLLTVDLAVGSVSSLWRFAALTNDGLLAYRHVAGQAGNQLVPDLARSMPELSPDGKTYTFRLRPNIRYSNGRPVRARDFRYAIERALRLVPDLQTSLGIIDGAHSCSQRRCNLAAGIVTDETARTITFHLSAPAPSFLYNLASTTAAAVPAGTSLQEAKRPLPATGPYRVASFTRRSVRLVRNPHFHEWSEAAQPQGFPQEIVLKTVPTPRRGIALVEHDKAELTSSQTLRPFIVAPRFAPRMHEHPLPGMPYLVLDPTRPPFNDLRARQALNYVVDRNKVAQFTGKGGPRGRPTCQVLPPNFPGYRRYCPYTLDPSPGGAWTAPDPAQAARLVAASGTDGASVTLWVDSEFFHDIRVGRYFKRLLKSLGYRTQLRESFPGPPIKYFARLEGGVMSRRGGPQVASAGWGADYPAASNFIETLFSCRSSINYSRYCDVRLDRKIKRAVQLEQTDRAGASRLWTQLDREITDRALLVPLYNGSGADLVSKRVGNYQYNPQYGALLSQLWVR